jgi:hypothetical protein
MSINRVDCEKENLKFEKWVFARVRRLVAQDNELVLPNFTYQTST